MKPIKCNCSQERRIKELRSNIAPQRTTSPMLGTILKMQLKVSRLPVRFPQYHHPQRIRILPLLRLRPLITNPTSNENAPFSNSRRALFGGSGDTDQSPDHDRHSG